MVFTPFQSVLSVGAWLVALLTAVSGALAVWALVASKVPRAALWTCCVLGGACALGVMGYTGLLLSDMVSIDFWHTPWLIALFMASSLSCGIACALALAQITGAASAFGAMLGRLAAIDAAVIVVEAAIVAVFVYAASQAGAPLSNGTELAAAQSVRELVQGSNAQLFWGCFAVLGLAVPFALDVVLALRRRPLPGVVLFASACVLAGGFVMRFCVVAAGAHPVLSSMGVM